MSHEDKLDAILREISTIKVVQGEQRIILEDHTRRSTANEDTLIELRDLVVVVKQGFENQIRPIQKHVDRVQFLFVLIVGAGAVVGAVVTIIEAIQGVLGQ